MPPPPPPAIDYGLTSYRRQRRVWPVVVGVVLAVVVVATFFAVGLSNHAVVNVYGAAMTFGASYPAAEGVLSSAPDGPWTPVAVFGIGTSTSLAGSSGGDAVGGGGCAAVWSANTSATLPATHSGAPAGEVAAWFLFSRDSDNYALFTMVTNVTGTVRAVNLGIVAEACLSGFSSYPALPSSMAASTAAAEAANDAGGSTFLADYPGALVELGVLDDLWAVVYTTCPFGATGGSGVEFAAAFNATTLSPVGSPEQGSTGC